LDIIAVNTSGVDSRKGNNAVKNWRHKKVLFGQKGRFKVSDYGTPKSSTSWKSSIP
jgi:hypothetical protein